MKKVLLLGAGLALALPLAAQSGAEKVLGAAKSGETHHCRRRGTESPRRRPHHETGTCGHRHSGSHSPLPGSIPACEHHSPRRLLAHRELRRLGRTDLRLAARRLF